MIIKTCLELLAIVAVVIMIYNEEAIADWERAKIKKLKSKLGKKES